MKKKICTKCKKNKTLTEFYKKSSEKDSLQTQCKECTKIYNTIYREKNPKYMKIWRKENSEKIKEYRDLYHQENKDRDNAKGRDWYQENREYAVATSVAYRRNKRATNPTFKVLDAIRSRQSQFFRSLKNKIINGEEIKKSTGFYDLLGCDEITFIDHMEGLFTSKMTWNNHGTLWHVDHVKPLILFDISNTDEQRIAFNYLNLQPLTAKENLAKGAKYDV